MRRPFGFGLACAVALATLGAAPQEPAPATTAPLGPGSFVRSSFVTPAGVTVQIASAVFPRSAVLVRLAAAPAALVGRQVASSLGPDGIAAITGGYFTVAYGPDGLLERDGTVVNGPRPGLSGVVGSATDGTALITPLADFDPSKARDAVQAGPFLIDPGGTMGIRSDANPPDRRAVALFSTTSVALVETSPVKLSDLASALHDQPDLFGVDRVERALNLSGSVSAGFAIRPSSGRVIVWPEGMRIFSVLTIVPRPFS